MNVLFKLLLLAILVVQIRTDCDVCQSSNGVACHSREMYSVCKDGLPTADFITCPDNTVCTSDLYVCYSEVEALPSCLQNDLYPVTMEGDNLCGVCDEYKVFACLTESTIAFCFGDSVPNEEAISYCPENTVCDINNAKYCSDSSLAEPSCVTSGTTTTTTYATPITSDPTTNTMVPTTPTTTETTTIITTTTTTENPTTTTTTTEHSTITTTTVIPTPTLTTITESSTTSTMEPSTTPTTTTEPSTTPTTTMEPSTTTTTTTQSTTTPTTPVVPRDPNTICKDAGSIGLYKTDDDVTCTKYVVCYTMNDELRGIVKTCPSGTYFHPEKRLCTNVKPDGCL